MFCTFQGNPFAYNILCRKERPTQIVESLLVISPKSPILRDHYDHHLNNASPVYQQDSELHALLRRLIPGLLPLRLVVSQYRR